MASSIRSITQIGMTEPFELQVARGQIPGHSVLNIFGFNSAVGTTFIAPWELAGTQYVVPPSATTMSLQSSSASDTAVSVLIQGLDADYNQIQEVLVTNGTTPVTTANSYLRINKMITTNGIAVGNISLTNGGITYGYISIGVGVTQMAQYTVPAGYSFYLIRIQGWSATTTGASKYIVFRNRNTVADGGNTSYDVAQATFLNFLEVQRTLPFKVGAKTNIQFQYKSSSGTNDVASAAEGYLVREEGPL
jgi:hypothetical protein